MNAGTRAPSLTDGLVAKLARPVGDAARRRAALHLLDWLGCALIGLETPTGQVMAAWGRTQPRGPSAALGSGRADAASAALVNGAYGNILEMDDIHRTSILHPGPVVIPAALALAEREGSAGADLLDAIVRGYEAVIRVGRSFGPSHNRFWHNTSTAGPFGAAAACGSLLGLGAGALRDALGNAGTQSSGLWQVRHEGAMSKQLHTGRAAHAGLVAADLARHGFTGPAYILEGPQGLYGAMCPTPLPEQVLADLDDDWLVFVTSFKPWPACRHTHATIDAALKARADLDPAAIARVTVKTYPDALTFCDRPVPATGLQAKFSLQHAVAVTLLDGPPPLDAFEPAALDAPRIVALRDKVAVEAAEPFVSAYPEHYGASVEVTLADGRTVAVTMRDALGDPDNPLPEAAVLAKARTLMTAAGLDAGRADAIADRTLALATGGAPAALTELLP